MEKNTNEKSKAESVVLHLETLTATYQKLLKEYNQMQADYIDYLNKTEKNKKKQKKEFVNIKGKAFWGKGKAADEIMANSVEDCRALCAENKKCSGATFDDAQNICYLRSGMGSTMVASNDYYAIVSKKILFISKMRYMNTKLQEINKEILDLVKQKADPMYEKDTQERNINQEVLKANYDKLKKLQDETEREIAEHKRLQGETENGNIEVKSNYTMFIILFVLAMIALILLIKFSMPSTSSISNIQVGGTIQMGKVLKKNAMYIYYLVFMMLILAVSIYFAHK